ncbi:MAG: hypothetical protein IEMM0008_1641 [bacterium]|nr:MAG: hypothetical protein IEMM0008_1641 [bacterium]
MTNHCQATQIGYVIIITLAIPIIAVIIAGFMGVYHWAMLAISGFQLFLIGLFGTLTVKIDGADLIVRFGVGLIQKVFPLSDLESTDIVKNKWFYGWGIRFTPHGWLYNVSGYMAVEIKMKEDKKIRIGTDQPDELKKAIDQVIA